MAEMDERIESPAGSIDGANRDFSTSLPYAPGTLAVLVNGIIIHASDPEGFDEVSPPDGTFRMRAALVGGSRPDRLMVRYIEDA